MGLRYNEKHLINSVGGCISLIEISIQLMVGQALVMRLVFWLVALGLYGMLAEMDNYVEKCSEKKMNTDGRDRTKLM